MRNAHKRKLRSEFLASLVAKSVWIARLGMPRGGVDPHGALLTGGPIVDCEAVS